MVFLIGLDDTDNKESRGTGYHSRQLGAFLNQSGQGSVLGITRHQLFFDEAIPFTSKNSSACIAFELQSGSADGLAESCKSFMLDHVVEGSDIGLCVSSMDDVGEDIISWGKQAKNTVLKLEDADRLARENRIYLEGLSGDLMGKIGALAAVGLRKEGNDGRFLWLGDCELRTLNGILSVQEILERVPVDEIMTNDGLCLGLDEKVNLGEWVRPVLINRKKYIIVEKNLKKDKSYGWKTAGKEYIKELSD